MYNKLMKNKKIGKITRPSNIKPEPHEIKTAEFFANRGHNIEFLEPSWTKGSKTPDIQMDGLLWEIKVPQGNSKRTIENNYRIAEKQAQNIIFDLRRLPIDETKAISQIRQQFYLRRRNTLRLLIITKSGQLLDIKR